MELEAAADGRHGATEDQIKEARRLQELLSGRFTEEEALRILEHHDWSLPAAVNFVFESEPRQVRQISGAGQGWTTVLADHNVRNLAFQNEVPFQVRQFACEDNDNVWWRKVPTRKPVSKCKHCRRRFEAVPTDREWGWAKFVCNYCGNEFNGFGQMNSTSSPCYHCGTTICHVTEIFPPYRHNRSGRRSRTSHTCTAPNCYNRSQNAPFGPTRCVHPRSLRRQVVHPSQRHISTGSTVATFLSQGDLVAFQDYPGPRNMHDISEDGSDHSDNS
ncbi:shiftless antiviral inhibitor of ribosomal frameshifting protein homolog [Ylistrum balloti]|uniref:shiftless antiviral inhibitor of ribosomal frameshifting protein homolog n=1 Tax=Ylistrum balloti TaxID=509963 RepID=UPI002905DEA0|nr:shiftless antiviral inhibitor of ribosomal frameshifting protein homolog [Ylistrum balloti]